MRPRTLTHAVQRSWCPRNRDLHKSYAYVFELGQDGAKKHYRVELTDADLSSFFGTLGQDAQVVVEASTSSYRFSEMVGQRAGRVVVSDPAQTRGALSQAAVNDHKAAETLARLLQSNFIREVLVPPATSRALRSQVALYQDLAMQARVQLEPFSQPHLEKAPQWRHKQIPCGRRNSWTFALSEIQNGWKLDPDWLGSAVSAAAWVPPLFGLN